jgi:hypothetical protein
MMIQGIPIDRQRISHCCLKSLENHSRMRSIENRVHFLRDHLQKGNIEVRWVPSRQNLVDFLTKPLANDQHHYSRYLRKLDGHLNLLRCHHDNEFGTKDVIEDGGG